MREFGKITLLLTAILTVCVLAGCQEGEERSRVVTADKAEDGRIKSGVEVSKTEKTSKQTAGQGKAMIKVENPVIDFGKLSPKDKVRGKFKFTNSGTGTLQIKNIKSSCGCAVINQAKMKKTYEPGEMGSFDITYTADPDPGSVVKNITIYSNAIGKPAFACRIKAFIETAVSKSPEKFNLSLRAENGGLGPIKLKSNDGQAFKILGFSSTRNGIRASFDPNIEAEEFVIHPKVDLTKFTGKILGGVINITLSHPKAKSVKISYSIKPLWATSPSKFLVMDAERGTVSQRGLFIKSNYGEKVEIESVKSQKDMLRVVSQKEDGNSVRMNIEIKVPTIEEYGQRFLKDTLEIKLKTGDVLRVDCAIYPKREQVRNNK